MNPPPPNPVPAIVLQQGSRGPETVDLQYLLHFRSPISAAELGGFDGVFGARTARAVRQFQAKRGLPVDGVVGPRTWKSLVPLPADGTPTWPRQPGVFLRLGDRGPDVQLLQGGLNSKGFAAGAEDGIFGPLTLAAVIRLQKVGEPSSNQVGVLGPLTWGSAIAD